MRIRAAAPADVAAIQAIEAESFSNPWKAADFRREFDNRWARLWVCEADDRVCGYMLAWFVDPLAELHKIAVASQARRRGIAAAMMRELVGVARAQGATGIWLEVRAGNEAAAALYRRFGFRMVCRRLDYYDLPREDALCFRLELAESAETAAIGSEP